MTETPRTRLVPWQDWHKAPAIMMLADADVMLDLGGPHDVATSEAKLANYIAAYKRHGFCRWALERSDGVFLGYVGVMPRVLAQPVGSHFEIGWRLVRQAWGYGYATEAALAALADFRARQPGVEVLAYTGPDNHRSQAVMIRLNLRRDPTRDFTMPFGSILWHGLVWVADPHL